MEPLGQVDLGGDITVPSPLLSQFSILLANPNLVFLTIDYLIQQKLDSLSNNKTLEQKVIKILTMKINSQASSLSKITYQ